MPTGVGIQLQKEIRTDRLQVASVIKDGPAYRGRVRPGDVITRITFQGPDGDNTARLVVLTKGLAVSEAEQQLLGRPGSHVWLSVVRQGLDKPLELEVTRGPAEPETVVGVGRKADDSWDFILEPARGIAYIRIVSFSRNTDRDVAQALADVDKHGIKGLILDLRYNQGGLIRTAVGVAELLVGDRLIMSFKNRERQDPVRGRKKARLPSVPVVCLVNGGTARAAEVLAACLQDHHRAAIVGERTAGKVGIQNIYELDVGRRQFRAGIIQFTTAVMVRPSGKNLSRMMAMGNQGDPWGVLPDPSLEVRLTPAEGAALAERLRGQEVISQARPPRKDGDPGGSDRQLARAVDYLRSRLPKRQ